MAIRAAQLILAAALVSGGVAVAAPLAAPAHQDRWRDVDGNNVTRVRHSGGGAFAEAGPGRWTEYAPDGRPIASLSESARDTFTVTLSDPSRGIIIIDLRNRQIVKGRLFKKNRLLYTITDVEGRRRGGGRGDGWGRDNNYSGDRWDRDDRGDWGRDGTRDVEVGPIWSQADAERKCRAEAARTGAEWTGQWRTTVPGSMSVCEMRRSGRGGYGGYGGYGATRDIEVGPIWNQRDAETKCAAKAREMRGEWTGQWHTTVQGRMSVCQIRFR